MVHLIKIMIGARQKKYICCLIPLLYNCLIPLLYKCKLIHTDGKQSSQFSYTGVGVGTVGWHYQWEWGKFFCEWCSLTCVDVTWMCMCIKTYQTVHFIYVQFTVFQLCLKTAFCFKQERQQLEMVKIENINGAKVTMHISWKLQRFHLHMQRNTVVLFAVAWENHRRISLFIKSGNPTCLTTSLR